MTETLVGAVADGIALAAGVAPRVGPVVAAELGVVLGVAGAAWAVEVGAGALGAAVCGIGRAVFDVQAVAVDTTSKVAAINIARI